MSDKYTLSEAQHIAAEIISDLEQTRGIVVNVDKFLANLQAGKGEVLVPEFGIFWKQEVDGRPAALRFSAAVPISDALAGDEIPISTGGDVRMISKQTLEQQLCHELLDTLHLRSNVPQGPLPWLAWKPTRSDQRPSEELGIETVRRQDYAPCLPATDEPREGYILMSIQHDAANWTNEYTFDEWQVEITGGGLGDVPYQLPVQPVGSVSSEHGVMEYFHTVWLTVNPGDEVRIAPKSQRTERQVIGTYLEGFGADLIKQVAQRVEYLKDANVQTEDALKRVREESAKYANAMERITALEVENLKLADNLKKEVAEHTELRAFIQEIQKLADNAATENALKRAQQESDKYKNAMERIAELEAANKELAAKLKTCEGNDANRWLALHEIQEAAQNAIDGKCVSLGAGDAHN